MASLTQLPSYFALFDESFNRTKYSLSPYPFRRYLIVHATRRTGSSAPSYMLSSPSVPMSDSLNECRCAMRCVMDGIATQTPLEVRVEISARRSEIWKLWKTGYLIENRALGGFIPVLDCTPHIEVPWPYMYQLEGDTEEACRVRQMEQRHLRAQLTRTSVQRPPRAPTPIPQEELALLTPPSPPILTSFAPPRQPPSPPRLPPAAAAPPRFVIELVKEKAIKEAQSCPITMTAFEASTPAVLTSCYHLFEAGAIRTWHQSHSACPVCKQEITGLYDA